MVGVDPAAQGRGIGATLTLVGLHYLADGFQDAQPTVMLYVEADNSAAVKTYRRWVSRSSTSTSPTPRV